MEYFLRKKLFNVNQHRIRPKFNVLVDAGLKGRSPLVFHQENEVPCLNCPVRYGKRPGEGTNHGLVTVQSSVTVIAIHSLSAVDMELTADLYLYQVSRDTGHALRCVGIKQRFASQFRLLYFGFKSYVKCTAPLDYTVVHPPALDILLDVCWKIPLAGGLLL